MRRTLIVALAAALVVSAFVAPVEAAKKKKKKKKPPVAEVVPVDVTFHLRNTAESGCADEATVLMLAPGDTGSSCGSAFSGPVNEALATAFGGSPCEPTGQVGCGAISYEAAEGLPLVLDATKKVTGKVFVSSYRGASQNPGGLSGGPTRFVMVLTGTVNGEEAEIGRFTADYVVTPAQQLYEVPIELELDAALDKAEVTSLTAQFHNRSAAPLHGFYQVNTSNFTLGALQQP